MSVMRLIYLAWKDVPKGRAQAEVTCLLSDANLCLPLCVASLGFARLMALGTRELQTGAGYGLEIATLFAKGKRQDPA